jgi:hypothetical protein
MNDRMLRRAGGVAAVMLLSMPSVMADPLEVPEGTVEVVETRVQELVEETSQSNPELADLIDRAGDGVLRDIRSDGRLDQPEIVNDIERFRDVERMLSERVIEGELEARIAELAQRNPEAAEQMRMAMELQFGGPEAIRVGGPEALGRPFEAGGLPDGGRVDMPPAEARAMFDRAYQEALAQDPEGAERMKSMFEAHERGEFIQPTPEMMERMHQEAERLMAEHPEAREHIIMEFDRMADRMMPELGDRTMMEMDPERAREFMVERMTAEGRSADEIAKTQEFMREMEARGGPEAFREMDHPEMERFREMFGHEGPERMFEGQERAEFERHFEFERGEFERFSEFDRPEFERNFENIQDQRSEMLNNPPPGPPPAEVLERTQVHVADHDGDLGNGPETHMHEIFRHTQGTPETSDDACHDHGNGGQVGC